MSIDPRGMTVVEWTDFMAIPLFGYAKPSRLDDPAAWKEWALNVIQSPKINVFNPPDPRHFEDWQDWAFRFNQVVPI